MLKRRVMKRALAFVVLLAACGGSEFSGDGDEADASARYNYKCPGMHRYVGGTDIPQDYWLTMSGSKARFADTRAGIATAADLAFDAGWSLNGMVRFKATVNGIDRELRVEPQLRTGGYLLHNGSHGGYGKVIGRAGEGYDTWSGICFRQ